MHVEEHPSWTVEADPNRLRQVFENLYRNAVEHGGPDVTITVGSVHPGRGFFVEDDGEGIPEDIRDEVVDPGFTSREGGNGFGLAIVSGIVRAHDWEIVVTEGSEGGARFEVITGEVRRDER